MESCGNPGKFSDVSSKRRFPESPQINTVQLDLGHDRDFAQIEVQAMVLRQQVRSQVEGFAVGCRAGEIFHAGVGMVSPGNQLRQRNVLGRSLVRRELQFPRSFNRERYRECGNCELARAALSSLRDIHSRFPGLRGQSAGLALFKLNHRSARRRRRDRSGVHQLRQLVLGKRAIQFLKIT